MKNKIKKINNRIEWIDTLRGLAMFFVVWGHLFPSNKWILRKYIYSFHMPLFFFISGLTYKENANMSFKELIKKLFKRLIIPYIAINIFAILIRLIMYYLGYYQTFNLTDRIFGIFIGNSEIYHSTA